MKISYSWLQSLIDLPESPEKIGQLLTSAGLEVEGIEQAKEEYTFSNVVIGEVKSVRQHPNADRLRVCMVDVGAEALLQIVCGASNVAEGQKVAVALEGAVLHPIGSEQPTKIKRGKMRGEESQGMICAEDELGLGTGHDGIMVFSDKETIGAPLDDVLSQDKEVILEIGLTPNRVDAASHLGVVRDLSAILKREIRLPHIYDSQKLSLPNPIRIEVQDVERCGRYTAVYIKGVTVKDSPDWLKEKLVAIGLRPINNIVDITNFVLMELGHPLHAFDADALTGQQIIVKTLPQNQSFTTLDGKERTLLADSDLMICDAEKPLCIAGVFGGLDSGVTLKTQNILLESAYFHPVSVRKTAKRLGLNTDSSFRFERGADGNMTPFAALRAVALIIELAGGEPSILTDIQTQSFPYFEVELPLAKAQSLIGKNIPKSEIIGILERLEMQVQDNGDVLSVKVPPYRVDVQSAQDVIEDILRIYGFDNVEFPGKIAFAPHAGAQSSHYHLAEKICDLLANAGLYEMWNNSLISKKFITPHSVEILNPLSEELAIMRPSLLWGGLEVIQFNQNRQNEHMGLFELGKVYSQKTSEEGKKKYIEKEQLVIFLTGAKTPMHWETKLPSSTLASLRREAERIARALGMTGEIREASHPEMDYCVEYVVKKQVVMTYGKVKQTLQAQFDIRNEVYYLVADWEKLAQLAKLSHVVYQPIPAYPGIRRDVSLLISEQQSYEELRKTIQQVQPQLIQSIDLHDIYKGKNIPEDKKSYLISILLQDATRTLEDSVADKVMERVYRTLENKIGAEIRKS